MIASSSSVTEITTSDKRIYAFLTSLHIGQLFQLLLGLLPTGARLWVSGLTRTTRTRWQTLTSSHSTSVRQVSLRTPRQRVDVRYFLAAERVLASKGRGQYRNPWHPTQIECGLSGTATYNLFPASFKEVERIRGGGRAVVWRLDVPARERRAVRFVLWLTR